LLRDDFGIVAIEGNGMATIGGGAVTGEAIGVVGTAIGESTGGSTCVANAGAGACGSTAFGATKGFVTTGTCGSIGIGAATGGFATAGAGAGGSTGAGAITGFIAAGAGVMPWCRISTRSRLDIPAARSSSVCRLSSTAPASVIVENESSGSA